MNLIFFIIIIPIVLIKFFLMNYYRKLFSDSKDVFNRNELLDIKAILTKEFNLFTVEKSTTIYVSFLTGIFLSYFILHLGGIYNTYYENYFLNSAFLPITVYLGLPYLKEHYSYKIEKISFLKDIFDKDTYFIFGISVGTLSLLLISYFEYRSLNFIWFMLNYIVIFLLLLFRVFSDEKNIVHIKK